MPAPPIDGRPSGVGGHLFALILVVTYWIVVVPLGLLLQLFCLDMMRRRIRIGRFTSYRTVHQRGDRYGRRR